MAPRPNILLIHCHDLGRHLNCYGVPTVQSPNLDGLAAEGVRFAHCFAAAPTCSPSRAALFTGRHPHSNGVMGLCPPPLNWDLHPEERHLAQYLGDAGYATAAVGVFHEASSGPARCGFQEYCPPILAAEATDAAIARIRKFANGPQQPFYLQVCFQEPHRLDKGDESDCGFLGHHVQPDSERGLTIPGYLRDTPGTRTEVAELQGAIRHMDREAGRLLAALRDSGLEANTLVVFTTDHGVGLPRAKSTLYDPGIGITLIVRLPSRDRWHGGRVVNEMVSNIDCVPTLLELLRLPVPKRIQGRSFAPLLDGAPYAPRTEVFAEQTYHGRYDPKRAIRTERHKLFLRFSSGYAFLDCSQSWRPRSETRTPRNVVRAGRTLMELYDLVEDPWEQHDLSGEGALEQVRRDLLARLHRHMIETADPLLDGPVASPTHHQAIGALRAAGS